MAWWLTYSPCDACELESCTECHHRDRPLFVRAVESEMKPRWSVDGPCDDAQCLLMLIQEHFEFDSNDGLMRLKNWKSLE